MERSSGWMEKCNRWCRRNRKGFFFKEESVQALNARNGDHGENRSTFVACSNRCKKSKVLTWPLVSEDWRGASFRCLDLESVHLKAWSRDVSDSLRSLNKPHSVSVFPRNTNGCAEFWNSLVVSTGSWWCFVLRARNCTRNVHAVKSPSLQSRWKHPSYCEQPSGLHHSIRESSLVLVLQRYR